MGKAICSAGRKGQIDSTLVELEWAKKLEGRGKKNNPGKILMGYKSTTD